MHSSQRVVHDGSIAGGNRSGFAGALSRTVVACSAALAAAGCNPNVYAVDPPSGHDRTLVVINGPAILSGSVLWDPGPGATWLSGGIVGQIFSVPKGATVGAHSVGRYTMGVTGSTASFMVDADRAFPAPRVDRVSLVSTVFRTGGIVTPLLYVQGANVDVGATIEMAVVSGSGVVWTPIQSAAHRGISNRAWDVALNLPYTALDYPVYHFLAFLALPPDQPVGSTLQLRIRNVDGVVSDTKSYTLPLTEADVDSDGDGIPDLQELTTDARLRPDIYLQLDHMEDASHPLTYPWSHDIAIAMQETFAAAPIINPVGPTGINLVIDDAQAIPRNIAVHINGAEDVAGVLVGNCTAANLSAADKSLLTLKRACFDNATRGQYWHYCVWAEKAYIVNADGPMVESGWGEPSGDDCIVAMGVYGGTWMSDVRTEADLVTHELGHNLGLRHGGTNDDIHNPTYNSVMSYSWLGRTQWGPKHRRMYPVCTTLFWRVPAATSSEVGGAPPPGAHPDQIRGYSDGMGRLLSENALVETPSSPGLPYGVCDNFVDWQCPPITDPGPPVCDGNVTDVLVSHDLNTNASTLDRYKDHADWVSLLFNGPALNGILRLASDP